LATAENGVAAPTTVVVYEPCGHQLPPLRPYLQDLWSRRKFALAMAQATLKSRDVGTVFGQFWLVINPLLLALVYLMLVTILSPDTKGGWLPRLAHIVAGLFAYFYTRNVIQFSATAITGSGKLIMNIAFPKVLLPISQLVSAMLMYFPTLLVYAVIHVAAGRPISFALGWLIPIFCAQTVFSLGAGLLVGVLAVYFRDTASFLPYALRTWLYVSPVLYTVAQVEHKLADHAWLAQLNPLYSILGTWNEVLVTGRAPNFSLLAQALAWAGGMLMIGGWLFLSRERDFAFRI
jgi:teichoic acid transport system permease protein